MANILTPRAFGIIPGSLKLRRSMNFQPSIEQSGAGVISGMAPSYFARLGDGTPASKITIELYFNGRRIKRTRTTADGSWRFDNLNPDMVYDVVARHPFLEAVISTKRKPNDKGMTVYELPVVFGDESVHFQLRKFVVKNHKVPLTISYGEMFPIEQSIDRSTGLVTLKITKQATEQTYPVRFSSYDPTDYKDIDLVVPPMSLSGVQSALEFEGEDGSPVIDDLTGRVWTSIGTPELSTAQKRSGDSSLYLNGSSYIRSAAVPTDGNFTFEAWIRPTLLPNTRNGIVMFGDVNSDEQRLQLGVDGGSSNQLRLYWSNSVDSTGSLITPTTVALDEWSHVVVMKVGSTVFLGLNGTFMSTVYNGVSSHAFLNYGVYRSGGPLLFTGYMDNMLFAEEAIYLPGTTYPVPSGPYPVG